MCRREGSERARSSSPQRLRGQKQRCKEVESRGMNVLREKGEPLREAGCICPAGPIVFQTLWL